MRMSRCRLGLSMALLSLAGTAAIGRAQATATVAAGGAPAPLDMVAPKIAFDVVSFKPCPPDKHGTTKVDMPMTADYIAYHCESLSRLIYFAYNGAIKVYNLDGYPKWVDDDPYEFIAKVAPEDFPAWQKLDLPARRLVMRTVLADAVKLKVRVDTTPKDIYVLTATRKVHLTPYKDGDQTKLPDGRVQNGRTHDWIGVTSYFQAFTMADLATILSANMDRVVADHTNIPGKFTFTLPFSCCTMEPDSRLGGPDGPTLEDGLEQLGLKLVPAKGPVERLAIDHIEKPQAD